MRMICALILVFLLTLTLVPHSPVSPRMFGTTASERKRPFATFLLPSLPNLFRRSRRTLPPAEDDGGCASPASRSNRSSVASASSRSSTSSRSPFSACSSPGSYAPSPVEQRLFSLDEAATFSPLSFSGEPLLASPPSSASPSSPPVQRTQPDTLRCIKCSADIAYAAQIVSKGFTGRRGRAYLVSAPAASADHLFAPEMSSASTALAKRQGRPCNAELVNIRVGQPEQRVLATGAHVVADIFCAVCRSTLGWKYLDASTSSQYYKIDKFILETARVTRFRSWEDVDDPLDDAPQPFQAMNDPIGAVKSLRSTQDAQSAIEFDSDDDDECEEIFAGTWDANVVASRRSRRFM